MLDFMLVGDETITMFAVPIRVIQRDQLAGVDMNQQRYFTLTGFCSTIWTAGKAQIRIRIEAEVIFLRQIAEAGFFSHFQSFC